MTRSDPSVRAYSRERMMKVALAMWEGILLKCRDEQNNVFLSSEELLDAMALLGGITLASWEGAKVPSQLRQRCEQHAKNIAERTRQAISNPEASTVFDIVLPDLQAEDMH